MERMNEFLYLRKAKKLIRQDRILEIWIEEIEPGIPPFYIKVKTDDIQPIVMQFRNWQNLKDEWDLILQNAGIEGIVFNDIFLMDSINKQIKDKNEKKEK